MAGGFSRLLVAGRFRLPCLQRRIEIGLERRSGALGVGETLAQLPLRRVPRGGFLFDPQLQLRLRGERLGECLRVRGFGCLKSHPHGHHLGCLLGQFVLRGSEGTAALGIRFVERRADLKCGGLSLAALRCLGAKFHSDGVELDRELGGVLLRGGIRQSPRGLDALALGGLEIHPRLQAGVLGRSSGEALAQLRLRLRQRGLDLLASRGLGAQRLAGELQLGSEQRYAFLGGAAGLQQTLLTLLAVGVCALGLRSRLRHGGELLFQFRAGLRQLLFSLRLGRRDFLVEAFALFDFENQVFPGLLQLRVGVGELLLLLGSGLQQVGFPKAAGARDLLQLPAHFSQRGGGLGKLLLRVGRLLRRCRACLLRGGLDCEAGGLGVLQPGADLGERSGGLGELAFRFRFGLAQRGLRLRAPLRLGLQLLAHARELLLRLGDHLLGSGACLLDVRFGLDSGGLAALQLSTEFGECVALRDQVGLGRRENRFSLRRGLLPLRARCRQRGGGLGLQPLRLGLCLVQ